MKKALLIIVIILLLAAYVGGYWPQHQQVRQLETSVSQLQGQLNTAEGAVKVCHLENEMLTLIDQTQAQNYGEAQRISGQFFNDLQTEIGRVPNASYTPQLQTMLGRRDAVVAGLARADSSTITTLRQSLNELRQIADQLTGTPGH
jgi:hypothetical protein